MEANHWIVGYCGSWNIDRRFRTDFFCVFAEAFGTTWCKHYCQYTKENRIFTMIPYTQTAGKIVRLDSISYFFSLSIHFAIRSE